MRADRSEVPHLAPCDQASVPAGGSDLAREPAQGCAARENRSTGTLNRSCGRGARGVIRLATHPMAKSSWLERLGRWMRAALTNPAPRWLRWEPEDCRDSCRRADFPAIARRQTSTATQSTILQESARMRL